MTIDADAPKSAIGVRARGADVLRDPLLNKGTAFSAGERRGLRIEGLLPFKSISQEQQAARIYEQLQAQPDPLQKYVLLSALQNRNTHLFYRLLGDHLEELMPIVYTPTVGTATQRFSRVFQGGSGVWITPDMKGRMADVLRNAVGARRIHLLVVTDNESILGLGDQGAGGMAISVGKLALYTAAAGIAPSEALPVSLDFGTDNEELLADDQYFGWPSRRLRGNAYIELVDEFVAAVRALMPDALVQWEDFRKDNALAILDRYVDRVPSFNDDIQGTGAVVMAGINSALRVLDARLAAQRIVILGAGAAGLGVARQINARLMEEGVPSLERAAVVAVLDRNGLLIDDGRIRDAYKRELAWPASLARRHGLDGNNGRSLHDVVRRYKPTILIGLSGAAGSFNETVVREMAAHVERPVIFPSSNPSSNSEAVPADLYAWTQARCLVATGSPYPDVEYGGRRFRVGQGNNVFVFPGLGLGALAVNASKVSERMTNAASKTLAAQVTEAELAAGLLFPSVSRLRDVSFEVAVAVAREAVREGLASTPEDAVERAVRATMWEPHYRCFEPG
ncbi:MAG TPA: oxaloacetate-decarboxylating malate dehydrogenase [Gammaproteobacteria bacterium]|nr:oxaloacetate-decarboxylating malate dehydrogenase [Gammaproteobacteria bacterium]